MPLPFPICERCGVSVKRMTIRESPKRDGTFSVAVECHGEWDYCEIDPIQFGPGAKIVAAVAFKQEAKSGRQGNAEVPHDTGARPTYQSGLVLNR